MFPRFNSPLVFALGLLLTSSPAVADRIMPPGRPLPGGFAPVAAGAPVPGGGFGAPGPPPSAFGSVAPPHSSRAAVIDLLEEDAGRLARALNPGQDLSNLGRAGAWAADRFSGATALKVAGFQRFGDLLAGWSYPIVGQPRPGEYRYLRFAWKKPDGPGIMLQLCAGGADWGRYFSGAHTTGFLPALQLGAQPPRDWQVVTRDLFADFGGVPFTLTGMAFTPMNGVALFDHVYLGRTIEDLDRVTDAARTWARKTDFLRPAELDRLWKDLASDDAAVRQPAAFALGACGGTSVPYLAGKVTIPDAAVAEQQIGRAVLALDAPRYAVRERAMTLLERYGPTARPAIAAALNRAGLSSEWRTRLEKLLATIEAGDQVLSAEHRRTLAVIHIAERADTAAARELLTKIANARLEAGLSDEAAAARKRRE